VAEQQKIGSSPATTSLGAAGRELVEFGKNEADGAQSDALARRRPPSRLSTLSVSGVNAATSDYSGSCSKLESLSRWISIHSPVRFRRKQEPRGRLLGSFILLNLNGWLAIPRERDRH
jgi:hypothetical protein